MRLAALSTWEKFEPCGEYKVFGSNHNSFRKWRAGEILLVFIGQQGLARMRVDGEVFNSNEMIWNNDLYEWRVPIGGITKFEGEIGEKANKEIKSLLLREYGRYYGFLIRNHTELKIEVSDKIEALLKKKGQ